MITKLSFFSLPLSALKTVSVMLCVSLLCITAIAQTAPPPIIESTVASAASLNLDSNSVAKEISKELPPGKTKTDVVTRTHDEFEKSLLNSENRKKVFGVAEVGASTGSIPAQHGYKSQSINCANAAVAVTDEISQSTQIAVYAETDTCKIK